MNKALQGYVVIGATGERVESDRVIISEAVANDPKWLEIEPLMVEMFTKFNKMDVITLAISGGQRTFQTKFLATAGMTIEDTDEEPTQDDQDMLDSISVNNADGLREMLDS